MLWDIFCLALYCYAYITYITLFCWNCCEKNLRWKINFDAKFTISKICQILTFHWIWQNLQLIINVTIDSRAWVGVLPRQYLLFYHFPNFSALLKHTLTIEYHVNIWQMSPQLSCGGNCQIYRQMGELWTLFQFECSLHLTHDMVAEMDGNISWVLFCITIFYIRIWNGMKFGKIRRKNIAVQSYPSIWGNFGRPGKFWTAVSLGIVNDLE